MSFWRKLIDFIFCRVRKDNEDDEILIKSKLSKPFYNGDDDSDDILHDSGNENADIDFSSEFIDPTQRAWVLKKKGNNFYRKQQFHSALEKYNAAISLNPKLTTYHLNRAATLYKLGDETRGSIVAKSIKQYRRERLDRKKLSGSAAEVPDPSLPDSLRQQYFELCADTCLDVIDLCNEDIALFGRREKDGYGNKGGSRGSGGGRGGGGRRGDNRNVLPWLGPLMEDIRLCQDRIAAHMARAYLRLSKAYAKLQMIDAAFAAVDDSLKENATDKAATHKRNLEGLREMSSNIKSKKKKKKNSGKN